MAGDTVSITAPMQRAVLAALALARGTATMDALIDALWDDPPAKATNVVQQYVSSLRRQLGRQHLVTASSGYDLNLEGGYLDAERFETLAHEATRRRRAGDLGGSSRLLTQASALVRGEVLADLPDVPLVRGSRLSLERAVVETEVLRLAVGNDLGLSADLLPAAEELALRHPLDEAVAAQLVRALAGVGRPSDALEVYALMRARLAEELGVEPDEQLQVSPSCGTKGGLADRCGSRSRPALHPAASTDTNAWS